MFRILAVAAVVAALPLARAGAQSSATSGRPVGELAPVTVTARAQRGLFGRAANLEADRNQLGAMNAQNRRLGAVLDRQEKEIASLETRLAAAKAENTRKTAQVEATEQQIAELRKRRLALEAQLAGQQ